MPQPHSRQQSQLNEIQMLQRQIMLKNLQELHRQKKLQELNDVGQQNLVNQQSLIHSKQAPGAPFITGTPVRDASQMFMFGNANTVHGFPNGLVYSQAQNQVFHSSFGQYSHFHGASPADVLTERNYGHEEDMTKSFMSDQFNVSENQERNLFGPVFIQGLDMGSQTGNVQNASVQDFSGGQDQAGWAGHFSEKTANVNASQGLATLDPLEQKILFNTDDNDWNGNTGTGGFENMFENTDHSGDFPSLQSGSWSALMQSAVAEASSNDTGVQEEWSGLSFQNSELSNNNLQNAASLSPKPELVNTSNASSSFPGFQPHFQFLKNENTRSDSFHESNHQVHQGTSSHEQGHVGEFEFVNNASHRGGDFNKEFLSQRNFKASEAAANSTAQTSHNMLELLHKVDRFGEFRPGTQSSFNDSAPTTDVPQAKPADAFSPSHNNCPASPNFGLRLAPPTQRSTINYFDPSQISQQAGHSVDALQVPQSSTFEAKQRLTTSGMAQRVAFSTGPPNVWVDVPAHQNLSGMGARKGPTGSPSTSDAADSRMETASEANNFFEHGANVMNSQSFGYGRGQQHVLPQNYSLLNPMHSDPINIPQVTSVSQLKSASGNYKTQPISSASRDQSVKNSFPPPLQDDITYNKDGFHSQLASSDTAANLTERSQINFPMTPSWFKDYGAAKVGQIPESLHRFSSLGQLNLVGSDQYGSVWPATGTQTVTVMHPSSPYLQHLDLPNQDFVVLKSKKRKFPTLELLPWHKEAAKGSSRLLDTSTTELEWAEAANRLPKKLIEEDEALGDSLRMVQPKKRLTLTTQLMQLLFRPPPAVVVSEDATTHYDTVMYFAARLALGDACSLANHSHAPRDVSVSSLEKSITSKKSGDQDLSKVVEDFIHRTKRLEDELLRLEEVRSVLDTRVESQELEKFSVINRFAKFHSRGPAEPASSGPKLYPQRYVTASPMPRTVPEGQHCLLL